MNFHYSMIEAAESAPKAETTSAPDYYAGAKRVMIDGAPCRVFQWRSRELSEQIGAIQIAAAAGCPVELADAPQFSFIPAERDEAKAVQHKVSPLPLKTSPHMKEYYKGGVRLMVGGVPCRLARPLAPNHTLSHWAKLGEPEGGFAEWAKRAAAWWEGIEAARPVIAEPDPIPVQSDPIEETQDEAPVMAETPEPTAEPVNDNAAPAYLVRTITTEGRVDRPFATLAAAVAEVGEMYLRREWASIHSAGIGEGFSIHPHGGRYSVKDGAKPFRWSMSFENSDGFKSGPCLVAERSGVRYASHRRGYQASNRAVRKFASEWDARMARMMPATPSAVAAESDFEPYPVSYSGDPVEALTEAPSGLPVVDQPLNATPVVDHETAPDDTQGPDVAAIMARLDTLEATLNGALKVGALPVESAPIEARERPKRSPAHERAIRRAWHERSRRRHAQWMADGREACIIELDKRLTEAKHKADDDWRRIQQAEDIARTFATKRRRSTLLARQRTRELVAVGRLMHEKLGEAAMALDDAKRSPVYFDADTMAERLDLIGRSAHHANLAQERAETAENALAAMAARCERAEEARDRLADAMDALVSRVAQAEAAVRAMQAQAA